MKTTLLETLLPNQAITITEDVLHEMFPSDAPLHAITLFAFTTSGNRLPESLTCEQKLERFCAEQGLEYRYLPWNHRWQVWRPRAEESSRR